MKTKINSEAKARMIAARFALRNALAESGSKAGVPIYAMNYAEMVAMTERQLAAVLEWGKAEEDWAKEAQK